MFKDGRLGRSVRRRPWPWALAAAVAVLVMLALATARRGDPALYPPGSGQAAVSVFVVDNGFHTDLVIPRELIAASHGVGARALSRVGSGPWIALGWGDERFYKETGLTAKRLMDGVRCLIWPFNRRTVVRMEALRDSPDHLYAASSVVRLSLSRPGAARLVSRLDRSFQARGGEPIDAGPAAHDPEGRFFRSDERFGLFHLCNHWIADLLNAAGAPTTPVLDTFAAGLKLDLRWRAGANRARST